MKKIAVFLFIVLLILGVNGNAAEIEIIGQSAHAIPEPITMLIIGFALVVSGLFGRKTLSQRCLKCPQA